MSDLRRILNSPDRVFEASRIASQGATADGNVSGSTVQQQASQSVSGAPPRPVNQTSEYIIRQQEHKHKRMASVDASNLRTQSHGAMQRPRPSGATPSSLSVHSHALTTSAEGAAVESAAVQPPLEAAGSAKPTITLEEAKKSTCIAERGHTMEMVFEGVEPEHMAQMFDADVQKEFAHVVTDCGTYFLNSGKVDTKKTVAFENYFNKDIWVMANLFRPERAQFRAREIVAHQASVAEAGQHPQYLVHQKIISEDGEAFLASLDLKEENVYDLHGEQLKTFINETTNGGFSRSLLKDLGLKVADAKLLVEVLPADNEDEDEDEDAAKTPSESDNSGVKYNYTVVMKTAPLEAR